MPGLPKKEPKAMRPKKFSSTLNALEKNLGLLEAEEFERTREFMRDPVLSCRQVLGFEPTEYQKAISWSEEMVKEWLLSGMLQGEEGADAKADNIIKELGDHALTKSHARHLSASRCAEIGLKIEHMEDNQELQEAILTVHHACILTLNATPALKIIENHDGKAYVQRIATVVAKPAR